MIVQLNHSHTCWFKSNRAVHFHACQQITSVLFKRNSHFVCGMIQHEQPCMTFHSCAATSSTPAGILGATAFMSAVLQTCSISQSMPAASRDSPNIKGVAFAKYVLRDGGLPRVIILLKGGDNCFCALQVDNVTPQSAVELFAIRCAD